MKKLTAILLCCLLTVCLAVAASAYFEAEEAFGEVKFEIGKQTTAWNADGKISDGEYFQVAIDPAWLSYAINDNDTDAGLEYAKATMPELYMSWDETYVYTATRYEVTKGHENLWDGDPASMWYSGAVQFNYANFDEVASEYRLEYGVGLSSDTGDTLYTVWADGCGSGYTPTADDAKVWLDGNTLTYETRVPWEAFADEDNTGYKEGNGFNFTLVWSIGEGQDYVHIQIAEGCTGNGKHAENMAQVTLAGAVASAPAASEGADVDADATAAFASKAPVIDGSIDDVWNNTEAMYALVYENDTWELADLADIEVATGYTKVLWSEDTLYLLAVVTDSTMDSDAKSTTNGINFWVSETYSNESDFNQVPGDWHIFCNADGGTNYYTGNKDVYAQAEMAAERTSDGYVVEVAVPVLTADFSYSAGHKIGYNISVDDDHDADNNRDTFTTWQTYDGRAYWSDPSTLNTVQLLEGAGAVKGKTVTIPRVSSGAVNIDGERDSLYDLCEAQAMTEQNLDYFGGSLEDSTGTFWALYDNSYIYLFVDIADEDIDYTNANPQETWNRESIGVMFDFSYNRAPQYEYSYAGNGDKVCYINLSGDGVMVTYHMYDQGVNNGLYGQIEYKTVSPESGAGHILYEIACPIPDEVDIEEGGRFGLEVIATEALGGTRMGCVSWSPEGSEMWHYSDVLGTAIWGAKSGAEAEEPAAEEPSAEEPAEEAAPTYTYPASGADGNAITGTVIGNEVGWGDNAAAGAAAAFDGNPATFFDPLGVGDGFCGIDAGESYILDKVVILSRENWNDRFPGAMIQGSDDGENWTTLWTSDTAGTYPDYYTVTEFENNTGYSQYRYYNETNHGDVAEVEFYGQPGKVEETPAEEAPAVENYALGAKVTVTSTETDDFPGELAVDGDMETRWASAYTDDEAITIDLGKAKAVNYVALYWETAMATDYEVYGSLDENDLQAKTLATVTGNAEKDNVLEFDTEAVRYITIHSSKRATEWGNSLYEIVVSGEGDASVDEALDKKAEAPNTFDFGIVAAVAAVISLGGFALTKKKH